MTHPLKNFDLGTKNAIEFKLSKKWSYNAVKHRLTRDRESLNAYKA